MNLAEVLTREIAALDEERITLSERIKGIDYQKRTLTAALKTQLPTPETTPTEN